MYVLICTDDPSIPETEKCILIREMFKMAAHTLDTVPDVLPTDTSVSSKLNQTRKKVRMGTIDCVKNLALCRRFRIHKYPTIAFFDVVKRWPLASVSILPRYMCDIWRKESYRQDRTSVFEGSKMEMTRVNER